MKRVHSWRQGRRQLVCRASTCLGRCVGPTSSRLAYPLLLGCVSLRLPERVACFFKLEPRRRYWALHVTRAAVIDPATYVPPLPLPGDRRLPLRQGSQRYHRTDHLERIRRVRRLQRDLGINLAGVEVVLRLTEELALARRQLAERLSPEGGRH